MEDKESKFQEYSSLDEFKKRAEFFPAGKIIPQRILKGIRQIKHLCIFTYDSYAVRTKNGYIVLCGNDEISKSNKIKTSAGATIRYPVGGRYIGKNRIIRLCGSPYTPGGFTNWLFEYGITPGPNLDGQRVAKKESEILDAINKVAN